MKGAKPIQRDYYPGFWLGWEVIPIWSFVLVFVLLLLMQQKSLELV